MIRKTGWLIGAVTAILGLSCSAEPPEKQPSLLPDPRVAREAVQSALEEWRTSPAAETTAAPGRTVNFVDQQRQPGQKLREFSILGETAVDNRRRFVVRLKLAEPDETTLAAYYVFGRIGEDPIWVYRAEDFDMMMNMDMAPDERPSPADPSGSGNRSRTGAGQHGEHEKHRP